jgi:hypothetical protein
LNESQRKLKKNVRIISTYLIFTGVVGILYTTFWPLTGFGLHYPEFEARSTAFKIGSYGRQYILDLVRVISGIGFLYWKLWAKKLVLAILILDVVYSGIPIAWAWAGGNPPLHTSLICCLIVAAWNGIWFYFVFKAEIENKPTDNKRVQPIA